MSSLPAVVNEVRADLNKLDGEFRMALPPHIAVDKFKRVALTSIQNNPDLLSADRRSLFGACVKAAQDGLLPDGREAALVIFKTKVKQNGVDRWIEAVQYMPMVGGILKRVRNSGELASITSQIVYRNDTFRYWVDADGEHIQHEPLMFGERGDIVGVYALAKTKDGAVYIETMTKAQVEKVRSVSRSKERGPWVDWWEEMARKTAIRRLSKRLPMSTDFVDQVLSRDDDTPPDEDEPALPRPTREQFKELPAVTREEPRATATATQADDEGFFVYDTFGDVSSQHPTVGDAAKAFKALYDQEPEASRATLCEANPDLATGVNGPTPSRTPAVDPDTAASDGTMKGDPSDRGGNGSGGSASAWDAGEVEKTQRFRIPLLAPESGETRYFADVPSWCQAFCELVDGLDPWGVWEANQETHATLAKSIKNDTMQGHLKAAADYAFAAANPPVLGSAG